MKVKNTYIDKIISELINNHSVQPLTDWETFYNKYSAVDTSNLISKKTFIFKNYFSAKFILVSIIIISIIGSFIFLLRNQNINSQDYLKPKKRIELYHNVKKSNTILTKDPEVIALKNKNVIIRKEIIIKDTLFMKKTVIIKE